MASFVVSNMAMSAPLGTDGYGARGLLIETPMQGKKTEVALPSDLARLDCNGVHAEPMPDHQWRDQRLKRRDDEQREDRGKAEADKDHPPRPPFRPPAPHFSPLVIAPAALLKRIILMSPKLMMSVTRSGPVR